MNLTRKKQKRNIIFLCFIALFLSGFVEKFAYPSESFNFKRVFFSFSIFLYVLMYLLYGIIKRKNNLKSYIKNKRIILYNLKYILSLLLLLYISAFYKNVIFLYFGIVELSIVYVLTDFIYKKYKRGAIIFNCLFMLMFNINLLIYLYSGSFLSIIMLINLSEINRISGNAFLYVLSILLFGSVSFVFPYKKSFSSLKKQNLLVFTIFIYLLLLSNFTGQASVSYSYAKLTYNIIEYNNFQRRIANSEGNKQEFYRKHISNYVSYDKSLGNKPNVIVIFTEGLSNHIIFDDRNIMPNLRKLSKNSVSFNNYYNHTAATYRGLIGQLFSGYQNNNLDRNNLISIQDILHNNGYYTEFINVEPNNQDFIDFVNDLHFDKVYYNSFQPELVTIHDKETYELLFDEANKLNKKDKPFFLSVYTLDTHVIYDSFDEMYGKGKNNVLNRFYNADYQFGKFLEKFKKSDLYDNTIIVFTSDHASYTDNDYMKTFKGKYKQNRVHNFVDQIPLYIYHKNVKAKSYDVNGRNSIDFAPTILDYIDVDSENYFLGDSLFTDNSKSNVDTIYVEGLFYFDTNNSDVKPLDNPNEMTDYLARYYSSVK